MPESSLSEDAAADRTEPAYQCMTKGVKGASDEFERGLSWVTSRRGRLKIFEDRLECGDWTIPFAEIEAAELYQTRSMFIPCFILKVKCESCTFQFGLNGSNYWKGELPFEVTRTKGRLKHSPLSIVLRILLVAMLVWYFFLRDK